jgi:hypothetical protein
MYCLRVLYLHVAAFVRVTGGALMLEELVHGDAAATAVDVLREEEPGGVSLFDRRVTYLYYILKYII